MPLDTTNPFNIKVDHNFAKIDDAIGFFPKTWRPAKKYSVGNTLPIAAVNTWLQFSLAYVAAIIITSNNLSFITDIFNPTFMPVYALVSVILFTTLIVFSAMRYMHKQKIKEGEKSIEELINGKIRGGKDNEVSEIAANALKIEVIPVIGYKKANFSIVLPISENQKKILESQREENKNKAIFLTTPYVISALIIVGALIQNRFSFANVQGLEWTVVALASTIAIVGICIAFSKLKNNEINNNHNIVKKFNNIDILIPFRRGSVVSVMEKKTKNDEEENDSLFRLIKLLDKHLTEFTDKIVDSFDKQLDEAKGLLDNSLLKPANNEIKETLAHIQGIRGDIKKDLDELHKEISTVLSEAKGLTRRANSLDIESIFSSLENAIKIAEDKIEQFEPSRWVGFFQAGERTINNNHEFLCMLKNQEEEAEKIKKGLEKELKKVKDELEELKNNQIQSTEPNSREGNTTATPLDEQQGEEKKAREKNRLLKSKKKTKDLEKENTKLVQELSEQEKTEEWREKINGKASDFLYYLLESIKLEEKDNKEEKVEETLRNFDNKIIIHWKDGSQTTCHTKKQGDLPSTKVDFVNQNIQAAWEMVRGKSL